MTDQTQPLSILIRTSEFRGDHSATIAVALAPIDGESVNDLVLRAKEHCGERVDSIEIRIALS